MKAKTRTSRRSRAVHGVLRGGHQLLLLQGGAEFFPAMVEAMDADPELAEAFHALTPGRQRSYVIVLGQDTQSDDSQYADRAGRRLESSAAVTEGSAAQYGQAQLVVSGRIGDHGIAVMLARRGHAVHLSTTDPAAHLQDFIAQLGEMPPTLTVERIDPKIETQGPIRAILS